MKKLLQILLLTLILLSQAGNLIANAFTNEKKDKAISNKLIELELVSNRNLDSALILSRNIVREASTTDNQSLKWESEIAESKILFALGQKDSAIFKINEIYDGIRNKQDTTLQINALCTLADFYQENFDFNAAIQRLVTARGLLTNFTPFDLRFKVLFSLGKTHRKMKDYTSALSFFNQLETDDLYQLTTKQRFQVFMSIGNVYADLKEYDKTASYFDKAYAEISKLGISDDLAQLTYNMGALYYRKKIMPLQLNSLKNR
ncbi:MAG: tetratricopeptide repeat protein [Mangrovibacterium sp.]